MDMQVAIFSLLRHLCDRLALSQNNNYCKTFPLLHMRVHGKAVWRRISSCSLQRTILQEFPQFERQLRFLYTEVLIREVLVSH